MHHCVHAFFSVFFCRARCWFTSHFFLCAKNVKNTIFRNYLPCYTRITQICTVSSTRGRSNRDLATLIPIIAKYNHGSPTRADAPAGVLAPRRAEIQSIAAQGQALLLRNKHVLVRMEWALWSITNKSLGQTREVGKLNNWLPGPRPVYRYNRTWYRGRLTWQN